ncbi:MULTISPECIES: TraG family conjugative transposon ATPase [Leeuwenhoekiella]|uniref:TraG family conjugative transposon ATPase n=1 Tax=Leeuwenhoekiella TaxID=283735 RepID=UPI002356A90C|nr:TraG family conjugative transposon ATPase [Leeuwenhoekiella blandensis]|tara:strand:+ start:369 stop:2765 length:2397 start_codon:yes stop_codon:yes gene_type:complete
MQHIHPIIILDQNTLFSSNGDVVLCYQGQLPELYSLSEKDYEALHACWFQALKNLPAGTIIHKQDVYQKACYTGEKLPNSSFLERATKRHFEGRQQLSHQCYLFFILTKNKSISNARYINPFKKTPTQAPQMLDDALHDFKAAVDDAIAFINNSRKMVFEPLKETAITQMTQAYFNGFNEAVTTDILLDKQRVTIGDHYFDTLAINSELCFGEGVQTSTINEKFTADDFVFHQGFIEGLGLGLNENHIINQIIVLDDKHKWRKLLDKKVDELKKSSNFGSQNKVILNKIEHILHQINTDETSRVIRGQLNVIYWSKDVKTLDGIKSSIKTAFKELDILPYYPKGDALKNYILNSYCGYVSHFSDSDLYVTDLKHALCLLNHTTNYKSDPHGILFNDRLHNLPVLKDVWDARKKRIKARNFAIFAPTGEGKSFLANNILRQFFEQGVRLVIIDLGGSYTKFAKLYPDDHIVLRYEAGSNLGINPFFISDKRDLTSDRLEDLCAFLFELYASGSAVGKSQAVALKKLIVRYYRDNSRKHSLSGFYFFIESQGISLMQSLNIHLEYFDLQEFLHVMSEYVGDGLYSYLFEIAEDQTYKIEDKRLIIFELDEVKDNKEILSVMLKLIKTAVQRTIWQNKAERGIILFDEFAKQLKFDNVLESVEFYYQAIRKQNGAIGIILQSINQLPANATSASILENTQVLYSLNNEKGYEELIKRLNLSSHDRNQLHSIRNNFKGARKYTEIFIKIGKSSNIFRLEVPPEVYAAYLTDGEENEEIMKLYEDTQNMELAIQEFINKKHEL